MTNNQKATNMPPLYLTAVVLNTIHLFQSQWISPSLPKLPVANYYMGVAYYQDTIYLLGGGPYAAVAAQEGSIKYNLNMDNFTYSPSFFPDALSGTTQWFFQLNNIERRCRSYIQFGDKYVQ